MTTVAPVSSFVPPGLAPTLGWLVERAMLDDDARAAVTTIAPTALTGGAADPAMVAQALLAAGRPSDAIRFVACALPPREGVWWAWVSARHAAQVVASGGKPTPPAVSEALNAVDRWINQPTDDTRRGAWVAGGVAGLDVPAGCAAAAVFFTGGSIASPGSPAVVPPPPGLHCTIISAAVMLAAAADPANIDPVAQAYVAQAFEIVKQLGGWDRAAALAKQYHDAQREQHARFAAPPASGANA